MLRIFVAVCLLCGSVVNSLCFQSVCQSNPLSDDFCCDTGSCCTEFEYNAENAADTITDLLSCTTTSCQINPFTDDFCCDDGSCCTETQYDAENFISVTTNSLSSAAIIGICAGGSILFIICVVVCVSCVFCNSNTTNRGTVVHNGTVGAQTQAVQQYPLGAPPNQTYPPVGGYDPTIKPYSIPNQTAELTF